MHATWPDERYEAASWPVALACLELLSDETRWIHRRVETVDLLSQELVHRQVSVDFTLPEALHDDLRIGPRGPWCVPLAILEKRPLRNFDLREHDEWRPILGASSGGPIAAGVVTAAARLASAPDELEPGVASLLALIARSDLDEVIVPEELRLDAWLVDTRTGELLSTGIERAVDRASLHAPRVALDAELLLAGSVLFATTVARSGEHRLVRGIFASPRWLLSIVAVAALAAAASVAFGADDGVRDVIWYSAGGVSLLACLSLAVGFLRAASLTRGQTRSGPDDDL